MGYLMTQPLSQAHRGEIPINCGSAEKDHEQSGHPKKAAEREFVIGALAAREDEGHAEKASKNRTRKDGEKRALDAEKGAGHKHHFYVAKAHAFASAEAEVGFRDEPEKAAAERAAEKRVKEGKHGDGKRCRCESVPYEKRGGAVNGRGEKAEHKSKAEAGEIHH